MPVCTGGNQNMTQRLMTAKEVADLSFCHLGRKTEWPYAGRERVLCTVVRGNARAAGRLIKGGDAR